jgi:hypothetical protein
MYLDDAHERSAQSGFVARISRTFQVRGQPTSRMLAGDDHELAGDDAAGATAPIPRSQAQTCLPNRRLAPEDEHGAWKRGSRQSAPGTSACGGKAAWTVRLSCCAGTASRSRLRAGPFTLAPASAKAPARTKGGVEASAGLAGAHRSPAERTTNPRLRSW